MKKSYLSDSSYNLLKAVVTLVLPAAGVLYAAIAAIWDLSGGEQVSATILVVVTFLGIVLNVSSGRYAQETAGDLIVSTGPDGVPKFSFLMDKTPEEVSDMADKVSKMHFKVIKEPVEGYLANLSEPEDPQT